MDNKVEFNVPIEELVMIYPDQRKKLFLNMIENLKIFCPGLTLRHGGLNYDSSLKNDYILIFGIEKSGKQLVLWTTPFIYTELSIPGYRYAVKTNQHATFFKYLMSKLCQVEFKQFSEFLKSPLCGRLVWKEGGDNHWKLPENLSKLINGMSDMSLLYVPEGFRNTGKRIVDE